MKAREAASLFGSLLAWVVTTRLCELAQTAGLSPIVGTGAAAHSRPSTLSHSFIIQMPSHVSELRCWRKATACASFDTSFGLAPLLMKLSSQSRDSTPSGELKVAWVPSAL